MTKFKITNFEITSEDMEASSIQSNEAFPFPQHAHERIIARNNFCVGVIYGKIQGALQVIKMLEDQTAKGDGFVQNYAVVGSGRVMTAAEWAAWLREKLNLKENIK